MCITLEFVAPKAERLLLLREALGYLTAKQFSDLLEMNSSNYYQIESGNRPIGKIKSNELYLKINELLANRQDPRTVNKDWWDLGLGQMFSVNTESIDKALIHKESPRAKALPSELVKSEEPTRTWQGTEFIDLPNGMVMMSVPLVDQYAYDGYLSGWQNAEFLQELPKHSVIVPKRHTGTYRAFEVRGDGMDNDRRDAICAGDIVVGRAIEKTFWHSKFHLHRFEDYVIVHQEGILTKRITEHNVEEGLITCVSTNPDREAYPDYMIQLSEVYEIYNVVSVTQRRGRR